MHASSALKLPKSPTRFPEDPPKYVYAWYNRGNVYFQMGQYEKAEDDFTAAIKIDPKLPTIYANRANVRTQLKHYDAAIEDATTSLSLMPKGTGPAVRAISLGNRAVAYGMKKDYERALVDLNEAIKIAPRAGLYQARGYALQKTGRLDLALKDAEELIRLDAKDAAAWNLKCWYRALMGRELDAALADCNKSIELAPSAGYAYDSRGLVYLKLKQYDKAIADYNAALKAAGYVDGGPVGAPLANNLYGRGISRLRNGDPLGGAGDMAAAKAVKPEVADDYKEYGI